MARKKDSLLYLFLYIAADIIAACLAVLAAYWIRFELEAFPLIYGQPALKTYINILPIIILVFLGAFRSFGLYQYYRFYSMFDEITRILRAVTASLCILMAATFIYREYSFSRIILALSWVTSAVFFTVLRWLAGQVILYIKKLRKEYRKLVIVGTGPSARRLLERLKANRRWGYLMAGFITEHKEAATASVAGFPVLGALDEIGDIFKRRKIDELILAISTLPREKMSHLILECEKHLVNFKMVADLLGIVTSQVQSETIDGTQLFSIKEPPLSYAYNRFLKRLMDVAVSLAGLLLLSPVFCAIAALIKLDSRGPVFYKQKRIGEDGRHFNIYKFRTMHKDAERETGPVWAAPDDRRKTAVGSLLRRYNLDELPQLFNVLRGDMSLVGPRPERPHFVSQFKESIPRYMARHKIKSGMTGWAQINGLRGETSIEERTKYDLYYIENWSVYFDIKILCMSLFALKNAY